MSESFVQETLHDSKIISQRVISELESSQHQILVAMAWFTDFNIYEVIQRKIRQGVEVILILSDRKENYKLDFDALVQDGATVLKIKNVGWGMMHQKFCIIDQSLVITGSYNWTVNAKKNHENVIISKFPKTVNEYIDMFFNIKNKTEESSSTNETLTSSQEEPQENLQEESQRIKTDSITETIPVREESPKKRYANFYEQSLFEFSESLDQHIATEVGTFDKELLKEEAYQRAAENKGDEQVLPHVMNSLYSNFINGIEVVEEKKARLRSKIDEQVKISSAHVSMRTENEIETINQNVQIEKQHLEDSIQQINQEIEEKQFQIKNNRQTKIPFLHDKIDGLKEKIQTLKLDFVAPPLNLPMTILLTFMAIFLISYLFVFYSSVAYIFIFSKEDAMAMINRGLITETPEVFNAHAISKIWDKGIGGILFLFLFVAIPLGLGVMKLIMPEEKEEQTSFYSKHIQPHLGLLLILIVDVFIAFRVAKNINEVEYLSNRIDVQYGWMDIIQTENFWLVFILGSLGVYLFSIVMNKLFEQFDKRNSTLQKEKAKYLVEEKQKEIEEIKLEINQLEENINQYESALILYKDQKNTINEKLQNLPILTNEKINRLNNQLLSYQEKLNHLAEVYKSQVENDDLPISKAEIQNRVNIYMEGWSKYLYEIYSIEKARQHTSDAIGQCELWLKNYPFEERNHSSMITKALVIENN